MLIFFVKKNNNDNGFAKTLPAKYIFCHSRLPALSTVHHQRL